MFKDIKKNLFIINEKIGNVSSEIATVRIIPR